MHELLLSTAHQLLPMYTSPSLQGVGGTAGVRNGSQAAAAAAAVGMDRTPLQLQVAGVAACRCGVSAPLPAYLPRHRQRATSSE